MKKRHRVTFAILLVAILGGLLWLLLRPHEPIYAGKPLTFWLAGYNPFQFGSFASSLDKNKANEAVRHVGTNAIPTLLRLLRAKDSPQKKQLIDWLKKIKFVTVTIPDTPAWQQHYAAANGLRVLGESASNAVPDLVAIYQEKTSEPVRSYIMTAFEEMGPPAQEAVPLLIKETSNRNSVTRNSALNTLAAIHSHPDLTIPACLNCLGSSEPFYIRQSAVNALAAFGNQASNSVPRLIKLLDDPERLVRESVTNALKTIDPEAAARAGITTASKQ